MLFQVLAPKSQAGVIWMFLKITVWSLDWLWVFFDCLEVHCCVFMCTVSLPKVFTSRCEHQCLGNPHLQIVQTKKKVCYGEEKEESNGDDQVLETCWRKASRTWGNPPLVLPHLPEMHITSESHFSWLGGFYVRARLSYHAHLNTLFPITCNIFLLSFMPKGEIKIAVSIEDEANKDLPPAALLYRPVRQYVYGVLFSLAESRKKTERLAFRKNRLPPECTYCRLRCLFLFPFLCFHTHCTMIWMRMVWLGLNLQKSGVM